MNIFKKKLLDHYDGWIWNIFHPVTFFKNKRLCRKYYFMLPHSAWTGDIPKDYKYQYTMYEAIPEGWRKCFGKILLEDLRKQLKKDNDKRLYFVEIKEKYGSLRMYTNGASQEVNNLLRDYEILSEHVCISCGKMDTPIISDCGWYVPICEDCYKKKNDKRGFKYLSYDKVTEGYKEEDFLTPVSYETKHYNGKGEKIEKHDLTYITNRVKRR